jgi:GNAT superfamily N-acetyltransferase
MSEQLAAATYVGDLGDGLICRWSTAADMPKIAQSMGAIYRDGPERPFSPRAMDIARVLMAGDFPYMGPGDFALVEDVSKPERPVVAYTCFWRLRWRYGDIEFGVTQPEMVATLPEYRNRGLVRQLFAMIHARSAAEGHRVQAITGIPYFYRQFGYEYVLDLEGSRIVPVAAIPEKASDAPEPFTLRLATLDDVPQLMAFYAESRGDSLLWNEAPETFWRHHIAAWDDPFVQNDPLRTILHGRLYMIVAGDGAVVGYGRVAAKTLGREISCLGTAPGAGGELAGCHAVFAARLSCVRSGDPGGRGQRQALQRDRVDAGAHPSLVHDAGRCAAAAHDPALCLVFARAGRARLRPAHRPGAGSTVGGLAPGWLQR